MAVPLIQVDAFSAEPFGGNPAAVCLIDEPRPEGWMQRVAAEMNLSETAFVTPGDEAIGLRWFTPTVEVDLCGHATLAAAHVLWEEGILPQEVPAVFQTRGGLLTARRQGEWIELDFPAEPAVPAEPSPDLLPALGVEALFVGRNRMDYVVEVRDEETVRAVQPDMARLRRVDARGIIVTSRASTTPFQVVARFFGPQVGIDEDPVTGSAFCCLGPYWQPRLGLPRLLAYQASARGGVVRVELAGDRVLIAGQAVTVLRGTLLS